MTFLAPLFLIGVLAAAIPVVLHLIHNRRATELPFPTLRFLRISVEKTRRRRRIQDLLLMVLRMLALLLVAVGLARPTIRSLGALWGAGTRSAVVVLLDNSASMGATDGDTARLETAREAARQILDELQPGDAVALLVTCGPAPAEKERLERTQEQLRQRLDVVRASYQRADLGAKIDEARALLAATDAANKQLYVLTDMQAAAWEDAAEKMTNEGTKAAESVDVPIIVVDCHGEPKPNVAIQEVRIDAALPIAGLPVKATVELYNGSSIAQQRHVELHLDGVKQASSPAIELPPRGRAGHEFVFTFDRGGLRRGEVRLVGKDGLELDDRRWFTMTIDRAISVAIVRAREHEIAYLDDTFYLQQAMAPARSAGSAIQTTVLEAVGLADEPLADYRVVFCVNLPALDARAAAHLRQYVADGGNVVWIGGNQVEAEAYNAMNAAARGGLLPGKVLPVRTADEDPQRDSWNVTFLDETHPAFRGLVGSAAIHESILVYAYLRLDTEISPETRVLARLDDGDCLLAERAVGRGRVLWLGTSCHVDWTNLPLRPIFLPMLLRLTYELAGGREDQRELLAGAPLVLTGDGASATGRGVEIEQPSGERVRIAATDEKSDGEKSEDAAVRYTDTHQPGVYVVRRLGAASKNALGVAVNIDPEEADSKSIDAEELGRRLGAAPLVVAGDPESLRAVFERLREGYSLWEVFLAVVLVLLVFETFLANRLVPRQENRAGAK